ncbi:MAG: 50S ribosomal protein L23 [Candidatus Marinimicrobia bacterium]|jgi:large subunit ribosomal protein L23|nr:50S ribosomal protein L23 [Candidatus Neomarinimicrobiota bacterium]MBT3945798.1 50S ribosomal protein L23 [Candidatus Neomarinimicrobiota bacterium]MBT4155474.1 50S ribosomal protein L23 [Candidatus Neomarinimicrobiota bacterium]MBT4555264.1 50S ribosomal protein L23 [Candidatus Neomarinimicrobiota bacterium]MBT4752655.1 50S ribosomal protein L23 [Candidatus Neomarinimicrobiota bacterium]|tara:strand:- start:29604 stop:29921 length:318 start_codon:yes stop_codon:yes gene_type:complete
MYSKIIIKPILTEKMAILEERQNKFAFLVSPNANKSEIKKAVETKFDVKVVKVATMNQIGKHKQMTVKSGGRTIRTTGKRSDYKKAVITLESGSTIDLMRGETAS